VITDKEVTAALHSHGLTLEPGTRDDLAKYIAKESATWSKIIKDRNIKIDN
jgi:tripartite-type tricarboxylate transporter receptor subunit TctC